MTAASKTPTGSSASPRARGSKPFPLMQKWGILAAPLMVSGRPSGGWDLDWFEVRDERIGGLGDSWNLGESGVFGCLVPGLEGVWEAQRPTSGRSTSCLMSDLCQSSSLPARTACAVFSPMIQDIWWCKSGLRQRFEKLPAVRIAGRIRFAIERGSRTPCGDFLLDR